MLKDFCNRSMLWGGGQKIRTANICEHREYLHVAPWEYEKNIQNYFFHHCHGTAVFSEAINEHPGDS